MTREADRGTSPSFLDSDHYITDSSHETSDHQNLAQRHPAFNDDGASSHVEGLDNPADVGEHRSKSRGSDKDFTNSTTSSTTYGSSVDGDVDTGEASEGDEPLYDSGNDDFDCPEDAVNL